MKFAIVELGKATEETRSPFVLDPDDVQGEGNIPA